MIVVRDAVQASANRRQAATQKGSLASPSQAGKALTDDVLVYILLDVSNIIVCAKH